VTVVDTENMITVDLTLDEHEDEDEHEIGTLACHIYASASAKKVAVPRNRDPAVD
jgi:hypothetical protein